MKRIALAALLSLFALPAFADPDDAVQYTWYNANGEEVGTSWINCSYPYLGSSGTTNTAYYTMEIIFHCNWLEPELGCSDYGLNETSCYNYCASDDYVALVLNDVAEDQCVD